MQAIRIKQKLASETIHLPELRPLVGKQVGIIVLSEEPAPASDPKVPEGEAARYPLRGSVRRYDRPFEAANEWVDQAKIDLCGDSVRTR
jgi:hypothetical protein